MGDITDTVLEWCSRLHISEAYGQQALYCFNGMNADDRKKLFIKTSTRDLKLCALAYCLYRCCRIDDCFITISLISAVSGCSKKMIWRSVKRDSQVSIALLQPQCLSQKYMMDLNMTKQEKQQVRELCLSFSGCIGYSPRTILGYCLYNVLQDKKSSVRRSLFRGEKDRVTVKNVCKHLNISPTCLFRFKRYIRK